MKLTKITASAFIITKKTNIDAAYHLLAEMKFSYVLQAIFADEVLEKFFSQTWQRIGGNFYIDIGDITAVAKIVNIHNPVKNDLLPIGKNESGYLIYMNSVDDDDLEILHEHTEQDTQSLLDCDENNLKNKIVYVAGHLAHKCGKLLHNVEDDDDISTEYLTELNWGGLHGPTLSIAFFVHSAYQAQLKVSSKKQRCRSYLRRLFKFIDAPMSKDSDAWITLTKTMLKAYVLGNSDREK